MSIDKTTAINNINNSVSKIRNYAKKIEKEYTESRLVEELKDEAMKGYHHLYRNNNSYCYMNIGFLITTPFSMAVTPFLYKLKGEDEDYMEYYRKTDNMNPYGDESYLTKDHIFRSSVSYYMNGHNLHLIYNIFEELNIIKSSFSSCGEEEFDEEYQLFNDWTSNLIGLTGEYFKERGKDYARVWLMHRLLKEIFGDRFVENEIILHEYVKDSFHKWSIMLNEKYNLHQYFHSHQLATDEQLFQIMQEIHNSTDETSIMYSRMKALILLFNEKINSNIMMSFAKEFPNSWSDHEDELFELLESFKQIRNVEKEEQTARYKEDSSWDINNLFNV